MRWVQWIAACGLVVPLGLLIWGYLERTGRGHGQNPVPLFVLGTGLLLLHALAFLGGRRALFWLAFGAGALMTAIGAIGAASVGLFILPFGLGVMTAAIVENGKLQSKTIAKTASGAEPVVTPKSNRA